VRDPAVEELLALGHEAVGLVEGHGARLGVEDQALEPDLAGDPEELPEERGPDPLAAPRGEHGEPPDPSPRVQAAGPDRRAVPGAGEQVEALLVALAPLELGRHALLLDEDDLSDRGELGPGLVPADAIHREARAAHAGPMMPGREPLLKLTARAGPRPRRRR
jgi:hypothetical protein